MADELRIHAESSDMEGEHRRYSEVSLPLRDLFAAFALAGMNMRENELVIDEERTRLGYARWAYAQADAMLAARKKE